jgi:hypothetical protein
MDYYRNRDRSRDRHEGQPQLFCIIPAPEGLSWVTVNLRDGSRPVGEIGLSPISQVGYSNTDEFWDKTVPHTQEWYPFSQVSTTYLQELRMEWVSVSHHSPTGKPKGSTCKCEYRDCRILGLGSASNIQKEDWLAFGEARLARFQKHEASRIYAREYQRKRKERLALEEIQSAR